MLPVFSRAIVRSNEDPDALGRVKVEYPSFRGDSGTRPSEWARLCLPYASDNHGMWFIPEVGDEVIVLFEGGNPDHPIVMGSLYSAKRPTPKMGKPGDGNRDKKNTLNAIKTRSGHTLLFDDSEGSEEVLIHHKEGSDIKLSSSGIELKHKSGTSILITDSGVRIENAKSIELGKGASEALIKGKQFMQLFNSHVHPYGSGSTSPTTTPMTPAMLSEISKTK